MNYWLHPEAEEELSASAEYYARHASPAVAEAFLREFERILDIVSENQQLGTFVEGKLRKYSLRRFPYLVIYRESPAQGPQIYAISHQSREPYYWRGRTKL